MIRESDIVARIEDDRIIAVLAQGPDPGRLARGSGDLPERGAATGTLAGLPGLTVSIGVAEYPACADTIFALLDAADHALSEARSQGRNRAVAAATLNASEPVKLARCAS